MILHDVKDTGRRSRTGQDQDMRLGTVHNLHAVVWALQEADLVTGSWSDIRKL